MIEARNLCRTYVLGKENQLNVLKNVSMHIRKGEFVSVMGPSGSGKSTLLYHLSGMDRVDSGDIMFNGQNLAVLSEKELARLRLTVMGFIFQQFHLLKNLSILDNIILPGYAAKKYDRKTVNNRAVKLMERAGIAGLANHDITQVSGGQLQRAAICRALINRPAIIFGDEPTGALNSRAAGEIMEMLRGLNESGTTILLVTHDTKVAAKTERILYMKDGKIIGEKGLGKYKTGSNIGDREKELSAWLMQMEF